MTTNSFYLLAIADADNALVIDRRDMPTAAERRMVKITVRCVYSGERASQIEYVASLTQFGWYSLIKTACGEMRASLKAQRAEIIAARTAQPTAQPTTEEMAEQDGKLTALKGIGHTLRNPAQVARGLKLVVQHRTRSGYRWIDVADMMCSRWIASNGSKSNATALRAAWHSGYQDGIWERINKQRAAYGAMP